MATGMLSATLVVHAADLEPILTSKVASRSLTLGFQKRYEDQTAAERRGNYRAKILSIISRAGSDRAQGDKLVRQFCNLVENLENAKAIAVPTEAPTGPSCENAWQATLNDTSREGDPGDVQKDDLLDHLLRMGGPIIAGTTLPHAHQWKLPDPSAAEDDPQKFHMEGDNKSIFADHRITLVWEEIHGQSKGASGEHHVFVSGSDSGSTPLKIASSFTPSPNNTVSVILHDQRNASLVYECQERDAVRHSLSLDFMLQTADDDVFELFATPEATPTKLAALLLGRPIPKYGDHFDSLLFGPASLGVVVSKLLEIDMKPALSAAIGTLLDKANAWHKENNARVPPGICLEHDRRICSIPMSKADFLYGLSWKAFRDLHMRIGCYMYPQNAIEEFRKCARITIRDMSLSKVWDVWLIVKALSAPRNLRHHTCSLFRSYTT
jgi:hypothetical protein